MECARCHHTNRAAARYCESCGATLAISPKGEQIPDLAEGERRQATILFADLSGYTAMGEALDPEELDDFLARIKARAAEIVERHGGIVIQFRGDEVFALFGIPYSHEDDPVRAVRAARELHAMVRSLSPEIESRTGAPLQFHSSVCSGLVVASGRDARDGTIGLTGDAVNQGARLATLAQPDEILLNDDAQWQVRDFFETIPLDPVALKGKVDPVTAHRIDRETPTQTRFEAAERRGFTRFAGRHSELETMQSCLRKSLAGVGQLVTVVGEAGVGKSRLVFEFRHGLDRSRVTVLQGRCQSSGVSTPYLPFIDTLRRGLQLHDTESGEALQSKIIANVMEIDPALESYLPHYFHLLSVSSREHQLDPKLQGAELRAALETALVSLIAANSRHRPVVWIMEDWHWTDDASVGALKSLMEMMAGLPLLIVVIYRPEYTGGWNDLQNTRITVKPLDIGDTETIIRSVLATTRLPDGLSGLVQERTGGNPFFTEEICAALLEQGHVVVEDGRAAVTGPLETLDLPETVQATIRTRVDRLDRESREVLRVASVLGREFGGRLLQRVCRSDVNLKRILERLGAQDLIQTVRLVPELGYMFKHVLTQVVVYETLLHQQRRALHVAAGNAIESLYPDRIDEQLEALAHHFSRGGDNDKAVRYLEQAGDKAAGVFSLPEARKHYLDAIDLVDRQVRTPELMGRRVDITLKFAKASHYATSSETLKILEAARELAHALDDPHRQARIAYWMGGAYRMLGNHPRVFAVLGHCMELAQALGDEELQAFSLHVMGRACYLTGDYARGIEYMERGIPISERLGDLPEVSYSYGFCADCHAWLGNFTAAIPLAERSWALAREIGDIQRQGGSNWYRAAVYCMHGDWDEALQAAILCTDFARRIGGAYLIGAGICTQGWSRFMLGERDKGVAMLLEGYDLIQNSGSHQGTALYASMVADHLVLAGMPKEAVGYANKALDFYRAFGEGNGEAPAYRAMALAAAAQPAPDWPLVDRYLNESQRAAQQRGERPHFAISLFRQAQMLLARNKIAESEAHCSQARSLFSDMNMEWWLALPLEGARSS